MTIEHKEARRYLRFPPDPIEVAYLDWRDDRENFTKEVVALIVDVAPKGGCSLIFRHPKDPKLTAGKRCRIQVGDLRPVSAEVVWARELDRDIYRCGFIFLE
ncbi:MAG: hypothetical protein CV045_05985 [Cyanobacteria bacterium M5B4]|nr:hypothetical protein [Cyanobacteria bacterium KgW148]PLS68776.1 MAG: hypothetical protein CV045_05985 [Cyanobacteria bacterium M5B4]